MFTEQVSCECVNKKNISIQSEKCGSEENKQEIVLISLLSSVWNCPLWQEKVLSCLNVFFDRFWMTGNSGGRFETELDLQDTCQTTSSRSPRLWMWTGGASPFTAIPFRWVWSNDRMIWYDTEWSKTDLVCVFCGIFPRSHQSQWLANHVHVCGREQIRLSPVCDHPPYDAVWKDEGGRKHVRASSLMAQCWMINSWLNQEEK